MICSHWGIDVSCGLVKGEKGELRKGRNVLTVCAVQESPLETATSTPGNSAPTPVSSTFLKGEGGGTSTPTSATSANKVGGTVTKKNKKAPGNGDDSETDGKENGGGNKKARTAFGAVRK